MGGPPLQNCTIGGGTPPIVPQLMYTDNAGEFIEAVKLMGGLSATCRPHVPQTNGICNTESQIHYNSS